MKPLALAAGLVLAAAGCSYDNVGYPAPPSSSPPTVVDVAFCSAAAPRWVAVQTGDDAWTPVAPRTSGALTSYRLVLYGDRAGVAVAREFSSGLTTLAVEYGLPAQLAAAGDGTAAGCGGSFDRTLVGTIAGLDTNEAATISVDGHGFDFVSPLNGTDFKLENLDAGPQDLLAARLTHVDSTTKLTGFVLRHDVDPAAGAIPIDFTSPEVSLPVTETLTLVGLDGSASQAYGLRTSRGGDRVLSHTSAFGGSAQLLVAVPEQALGPSDLQFVTATSTPVGATNVVRAAKAYFRSPAGRSLVFGPVPVAPQVTVVAADPGLRVSARFVDQPEYDQAAGINFQQGQSTVVSVIMTDAYARRAGGYRLVVPDFSLIAGFESEWALDGARPILWTSSRIGGTLGLGVNAVPVNGTVVRIATDAGTITPP